METERQQPPPSPPPGGNPDSQYSLTAAKDRAQLTATTAMSVVHVALLKVIIDAGPDSNRFYVSVITLIVVALVLQVVIGFLALYITHTKKHYESYHSDMCSEWFSTFCKCCRSHDRNKSPSGDSKTSPSGAVNQALKKSSTEMGVTPGVDNQGFEISASEVALGKDEVDCKSRSPVDVATDALWTTGMTAKNGMVETLYERHETLSMRLMQAEMENIEAEIELERLKMQLEKETKRRHHPETIHENSSIDMVDGPELAQVETAVNQRESHESDIRVLNIEHDVQKCDATKRRLLVLRRQVTLLSGAADDAQSDYILKKVSFWQNVINYLLYVVFICNAFLAGLGVTGSADNDQTLTTNATK